MKPESSRRSQASRSAAHPGFTQATIWQALFLAAVVLFIYWPALHGDWIGDDRWYIPNNPLMSDPARLWKAWFAPGSWVEYYPIEESVQWYQWNLWHTDTFGYHLTNVVLQILNAFLIWHLFRKFGLRFAWAGALVFAVHPETVDSVAEMVELKNALSLAPFLIAMSLYMDYDATMSRRLYLWSLTFFIIAMLCKITMMAFPFVILLYAWWKRGRIAWDDVRASLPFLAVSLCLGYVSIRSGQIYSHPVDNWDQFGQFPLGGLLFRFVLMGQVTLFYFSRVFLPVNPMPIYPKWPVDPSSWTAYLPWLVLAVAFVFLWSRRSSWGRHALFGIAFFLITLGPFLGLKYISYMNATWILDHMLYIPIIGLVGLAAAACEKIQDQLPLPARSWSIGLFGVVVLLLTLQSRIFASQFTSEEAIGFYNLRFNESEGLRNNVGCSLEREGNLNGAMEQFNLALADKPNYAIVYSNIAGVWLQRRDFDKAIDAYYKCVACAPEKADQHAALADTLFSAGRYPEAIDQYRAAADLKLEPARMYCRIGESLFCENKPEEGLKAMQHAVELNPNLPIAQYNLGKGLCQTGQTDAGIKAYRRTLELAPHYAPAHNNLGIILIHQGHIDQALEEFRHAVADGPDFTEARQNLEAAERLQAQPSTVVK